MNNKPKVSIIMGSKSDLDTMRIASEVLRELELSNEIKIISAHRTPDLMFEFAKNGCYAATVLLVSTLEH